MVHRPEWLAHTELQDPEVSAAMAHVDFDQPNIARIYDYLLGGSTHFAVDREVGGELVRLFPEQSEYATFARAFLGRAVRTLVTEYGIDQFLDLGSGIPTVGNVHEIAHQANPHARVAYVDWETIAVSHSRRLLGDDEHRVTVTQADVAAPESVLAAPGVAGLLDFSRPIAVIAVGILDIIHTPHTQGLLNRYRAACAAGSALVLSHEAQLAASDEQIAGLREQFARTSTPDLRLRTRDEVAQLLDGASLLQPGVVPTAAWRPERPVTEHEAARSNAYAAVGLLH